MTSVKPLSCHVRRVFILVFLFAFSAPGLAQSEDSGTSKEVTGTTGYSQERFKKPPPYNGPPRSGAQVYAEYCQTCHARSTQGAPLPDDDIQWRIRLRQGVDVLVAHTINGYKELMPERGGCRNCSDAEVRGAVMYILNTSGLELPEKDTKKQ
jgi:cytochrome c5